MNEHQKAVAAVTAKGALVPFMSRPQRLTLGIALKGEERDYFTEVINKLVGVIDKMPKTYETDGQGNKAIVYLHYFKGGIDAWVVEKDVGDEDEIRQLQAFGAANLGWGAELGYINLEEMIFNGAELDLYWTPKTLEEVL